MSNADELKKLRKEIEETAARNDAAFAELRRIREETPELFEREGWVPAQQVQVGDKVWVNDRWFLVDMVEPYQSGNYCHFAGICEKTGDRFPWSIPDDDKLRVLRRQEKKNKDPADEDLLKKQIEIAHQNANSRYPVDDITGLQQELEVAKQECERQRGRADAFREMKDQAERELAKLRSTRDRAHLPACSPPPPPPAPTPRDLDLMLWRCIHCRRVTVVDAERDPGKCECGKGFYPTHRQVPLGRAMTLEQVAGEHLKYLVRKGAPEFPYGWDLSETPSADGNASVRVLYACNDDGHTVELWKDGDGRGFWLDTDGADITAVEAVLEVYRKEYT